MQWDNFTLVRKWHEYVGPKDERLEAEEAKVYKTGFMLLSIGTLVLLIYIYQLMAQQVAWIHKDDGASYDMFANPVEAAMYIWLLWSRARLCRPVKGTLTQTGLIKPKSSLRNLLRSSQGCQDW